MTDYSSQLGDLASKLASSKRILLTLPTHFSVDALAAGLALSLALQKNAKTVFVVSEGSPLVSHSNLYGLGEVKSQVPASGEGNFIIKLDGVVDPSGQLNTVPSLEKLDWYPEGSALNLVFHVVPGQRFEPSNVSYNHENSGFDLIISLGAASLDELGQIYLKNAALFSKSTIVNIDINSSNSQFGNINLVDSSASSISEILVSVMNSLGLLMDSDIASNIVAGIYSATANLTQKVNPNTFAAVSTAMQFGGKLPEGGQSTAASTGSSDQFQQAVVEQPVNQIQFTASPQPAPPAEQVAQTSITTEGLIQPTAQPVQGVAAADQATPVDDLYSNPFLNPSSQPLGGGSLGVQPVVDPMASGFPAPATGPTFNFGQIDQSGANSGQSTVVSSQPAQTVTESEPAPIPAQMVDLSGPLSTIMQAQQQNNASDLKQIFQVAQMPEVPTMRNSNVDSAVVQPLQQSSVNTASQNQPMQSSPEERPAGEGVTSINPEAEANPTPDWLVPKIFKGGSLG